MANHHSTFSDFSYDVFLGFSHGTSDSNAFVDRLYQALRRKNVNTFRDEAKLRTGEGEIRASIEEIEKSKMAMLVICENFASSVASLEELLKISEYIDNKRKQVTVVFYIVEPGDVRKQKNKFKEAMDKYDKEPERVKAWRNALTRVCDLRGEHYKGDVDESEFIERIAQDTFNKIAPVPVKTSHVVGIDSHFERLKSFIDVHSDDTTVRMLGIYGAGGIGKTTLAACLYNKIMHCFEAKSFLFKVREESNKDINSLEDLQKTLLSKMGGETKTMTGSTLQLSIEIKRRLGHRKVLLVLDDVDTIGQLKLLAGGYDWFGFGSRIIVTTRDVAVLDNHVQMEKYKMEELNERDSRELFCWNAFDMKEPAKDFETISSRAVSYAKGIPLALQVIGSNLKGRSIEEWEIELGKYRKIPDAKIQDVLEISYHSLSESEKRIFLDIACFFRGEKWAYVKRILEACDLFPSSTVFENKCLITLDENGCLEMHDLIQDMGREIVRMESPSDPGNRSRLWSHKDVLQVLKGNSGSSTVEGIMLHPPRHENVDAWTNSAFENMKNLRILIVRNTTFSAGPSYLPNNLRLLDWMEFPSKFFPPNFYPERMVDFKLSHSPLVLKQLQKFEDLTFINVSQCQSITLIPSLFGARNLRVLMLDRCHKLEGFDKSIGFMPKLVYLSASECAMLRSFVPEMYLPSLEVLSFNFCTGLEHFPNVTRKMNKPLRIHLMNTAIKNFPVSISNLIGLEFIDVSGCKGLKGLPKCIKDSSHLRSLDVSYCENLTKIPELPLSIQKIDARYCQSLTSETVDMLWTQVYEEKEIIQVVMPNTKIPDWFDCVGNEGIPHFWARQKFPAVALSFVFGEVKYNGEIKMETSNFIPRMESNKSHIGLSLFIDDQEICCKNYHHLSIGEHHVLLCNLRALFNDQDWQSLDAYLVGDDWKAIQIQCESDLVLRHWGIFFDKNKPTSDDTHFSLSNPNPLRDYFMPSSSLVRKTTPKALRSDIIEIINQYLNSFNPEQSAYVANLLLRSRNTESKSNIRGEASAHYGASLMQEHEDDVWDVAQILEMLMQNVTKHVIDSKFQNAGRLVVELLTTQVHGIMENGHEKLHTNMNMPIILEECERHHYSHDLGGGPSRRCLGTVELEEGDPLVWRMCKSKEAFHERVKVVLLRCESCHRLSTDEASSSGIREERNDPALLELMRSIEDDAMRLNKSCGKLKASIIPMDDVPVSEKYMLETAIIRGQQRLGRLGSKFKKTPYGMLREEKDAKNQNQHGFREEHHIENQSSTQKKNKLGWTNFVLGGFNIFSDAFRRKKG